MIDVDPRVQEEFDRNLAGYRDRTERIGDSLAARQRQIAEQVKAIDAKASAERGKLISDAVARFDKNKMEGDKPPRPASTWPGERGAREDGVMSFGGHDEEEAARAVPPAPPAPAPAPPAPVAQAPRRPAHRARDAEDDDYSEESWLR